MNRLNALVLVCIFLLASAPFDGPGRQNMVIDPLCVGFDSTTAVTAQTMPITVPWAQWSIVSVDSSVQGGGSFTAVPKIGSNALGNDCASISVSSSGNVTKTCGPPNLGAGHTILNVVISSPSGTVNQANVCLVAKHTTY